MNVMGFSAKPNDKCSKKSKPDRDADAALTPSRRPSPAYDDDMHLTESFESLASKLRGPTPKRPKSVGHLIHASQASAPETPAVSIPESGGNVAKTGPRQPLIEAGINSPFKSQVSLGLKGSQGVSSSNMNENQLQNLEMDMDLEFSKDFIFRSTAFSSQND